MDADNLERFLYGIRVFLFVPRWGGLEGEVERLQTGSERASEGKEDKRDAGRCKYTDGYNEVVAELGMRRGR